MQRETPPAVVTAAAGVPTLAIALRRHWLLVLVTAVIGAAAGVAVASAVKAKFSSTTQLLVGSPNATVDAVPGFAQATQSLAASYSRAAGSSQVIAPIARRLGEPVSVIASDLSVTPVPNSNIITISARGSSAEAAQRLARTASSQLRAFVAASQAQGGSATALLGSYGAAARLLVAAQNRLHHLQARHVHPGSPAYTSAQTALDVAQLRAQALSTEYSSTVQDDAAAAGISVLTAPSGATSNRSSTTEKVAVVGLVAGIVLGALLAFVAESRRYRRPVRR